VPVWAVDDRLVWHNHRMVSDNRSSTPAEDAVVFVGIPVSILAAILDFGWYRHLDPAAAVRVLLQHALAWQNDIETRYGDRRQSPDEVVVDSRS
jgi:hypothetical protein